MLTASDIQFGLHQLKIVPGDTVLVHSSFKSLGPVDGGPHEVVNAIVRYLGKFGTLIVPTYNFEFCQSGIFDVFLTQSKMGIITEIARRDYRSYRIPHPIYSFSIIGKYAQVLGNMRYRSACGPESIFSFLRAIDAKIIIIGLSYNDSMTFFHHIEECEGGVTYRSIHEFPGTVIYEDGTKEVNTWTWFARDLTKPFVTAVDPMGKLLEEYGVINIQKIGDATVKSMRCKDVYRITAQHLTDKPGLLYAIEKTHDD